ncbi:hypothetical protein B0T18DRAFT_413473 [Schizothecium vesticola]|uniref:Uncharacterized protein n=1 Tax=Schizothecium vesticola TaxID=314040 RepID=A0AA40K1P3_9PEZI|nr:hypothetical protein B0T18DRAFT_413473 [Schizothecium vesticola]
MIWCRVKRKASAGSYSLPDTISSDGTQRSPKPRRSTWTLPVRPLPQKLAGKHSPDGHRARSVSAESDIVPSWSLVKLPPPAPSGHPSSSSESMNSSRTPSRGTESDLSVTASEFEDFQDIESVSFAEEPLRPDLEEFPTIEFRPSSRDRQGLHLPSKSGLEERSSIRASTPPNPSTDRMMAPMDSSDNYGQDDFDENSPPAPCSRPSSSPPCLPEQILGFPCPFSLYNEGRPLCGHPRLRSPKSVEEHLFFHHRQPPFCPVCGLTFPTHALSNAHVVSRSCEKTESPPVVEGLTQRQISELARCLDSQLSSSRQYRGILEVVHPGTEKQRIFGDDSLRQIERAPGKNEEEYERKEGRTVLLSGRKA